MDSRKNPWLPYQLDLLKRLVEAGLPYKDIAERVGHPVQSCRTVMSEMRTLANGGTPKHLTKRRARLDPKPAAPQRLRLQETSRAPAAAPQPTSTFRYVMDAELRGRIEGQGVTAGLLGDPMPGRSALDKVRAGEVDPPPLLDSNAMRFAPRRVAPWVTLPAGPLR